MDTRRHLKKSKAQAASTAASSAKSAIGLDWFVFFLADVQTGFGPFIAVYLTANKWSQSDIGLLLSVSSLIVLFGQIPAGVLLDSLATPLRAAAIAVAAIGLSALIFALSPTYLGAYASRIMQAGASCLLGPAIAAISLGLVARSKVAERLGRNASFASVGTALAAAGMGYVAITFPIRLSSLLPPPLHCPRWSPFFVFHLLTSTLNGHMAARSKVS